MRHALVIGAGIGGMAAAIALAQTGWQVTVAEQAAELGEVGAGLQISPNGAKVLTALGVDLTQGFQPEAVEMRLGKSAQRIFKIALGDVALRRWGAPYHHIHRADLLEALRQRAAQLPNLTLRTGLRLTSYTGAQTLCAEFENGQRITCDLLVGADGLHSVVRAQMHGPDRPRFTGAVAWRLTVPRADLKVTPPPTACAWAGDKKHAVTYYLRGGKLVNFVGIIEEDEAGDESWTSAGKLEVLKSHYTGWSPCLSGILDAAQTTRRWALFDRAPLAFWSKGNAVLLGDAAHPMLPSLAQGACMALEDALALAKTLAQNHPLSDYYDSRIARVSRVQAQALENLKLFHHQSSVAKLIHYAPLWAGSRILPREAHRRLDWLYGFEP